MKIRNSSIENFILIILLGFAPLALASVHAWAYCAIALVALIIFNLHFLNDTGSFKQVIRRPESIGAIIFLAVSLFYVTPLPPVAIKFLSPSTYALWQNYTIDPPGLMTLSVYVHATSLYILKFVTYFMVFLVVVAKITSQGVGRRAQGVGESSVVGRQSSKDNLPFTIHNSHSPHSALRTPHYSYIQLGALCAVLSILIHSLSDFNLHIPANALYFTVMLALVTGISGSRSPHSVVRSPYSNALDARFLSILTNSIILIAFAIAVFGILQKLSYNGKIYWVIKKAGSHFGPYVNYDHYAGYMEMCVFLAIASFLARISESSLVHLKKWKDKVVWFSTKEANKTLIYLFFAVVMTTALFMTTSRGGIMSFIAALSIMYFACLISAERKKRKRILIASAAVVVLIVIMFAWVGPEETLGKFERLQALIKAFIKERAILSELRPFFWQDTVHLIKDFPVVGTGMGTYQYIFPKYRTFSEHRGLLQFAHNDYIQLIAEMGVVGGVFLVGFLVWYARRFGQCLRGLREN